MISEEAVDLLRQVQKALREQPEHFDMDYWFRDWADLWSGDPELDEWGRLVVEDQSLVPDVPLVTKLTPSCGTTACIAGWVVAAAGERVTPGFSIQFEAERLVGWDREPQLTMNCPLFHVGHWPRELQNRYCWDDGPERVEAACAAIDQWIEAGGDPERFV